MATTTVGTGCQPQVVTPEMNEPHVRSNSDIGTMKSCCVRVAGCPHKRQSGVPAGNLRGKYDSPGEKMANDSGWNQDGLYDNFRFGMFGCAGLTTPTAIGMLAHVHISENHNGITHPNQKGKVQRGQIGGRTGGITSKTQWTRIRGRLDSGAQIAARHEASGMGCVLCTTTLPSLPAIFFPRLSSSFRTRCDFAREKLMLILGTAA